MTAIVRVKRRNDEDPLDALVTACKRQKTEAGKEEADTTPLTAVLEFASSVKKDDDIKDITKVLSKDELQNTFKQHIVDITSKARQQTKQKSLENRYKVVNCFRSLALKEMDDVDDKVTVIDVEGSVSCSESQDPIIEEVDEDDYVYDVYYTETECNDRSYYSLRLPTPLHLILNTGYRDDNPESECDSDDSNSESNWRNDYPDSDHSEGSIIEDDIREAVANVKIESESDLSTDDDFVYTVDESDVESYGYKYARYKARVKAEMTLGDGEYDNDDPSELSDVHVSDELD